MNIPVTGDDAPCFPPPARDRPNQCEVPPAGDWPASCRDRALQKSANTAMLPRKARDILVRQKTMKGGGP